MDSGLPARQACMAEASFNPISQAAIGKQNKKFKKHRLLNGIFLRSVSLLAFF